MSFSVFSWQQEYGVCEQYFYFQTSEKQVLHACIFALFIALTFKNYKPVFFL